MNRKQLIKWMITVAAGWLIMDTIVSHVGVSLSDSNDFRYFIHKSLTEKPERGDYVIFRFDHADPVANIQAGSKLVKHVACMPGDMLSVQGDEFYCNGELIGKVTVFATSDGVPLTTIEFDGILPEGKYFMMGDNPRSYDSRYYGFIDENQLLGKVYPLF